MARSRLWSWRVLRLHATLFILCVSFGMLADWQIHRALSGNGLSWAYAFEWPLFIVYAVVLWRRLLLDELHGGANWTAKHWLPMPDFMLKRQQRQADRLAHRGEIEDVERERYNRYLEELHARDSAPPTS